MQHCEDDVLALVALGEQPSPADSAHLAGCATCRAEVESFARTVTAGGGGFGKAKVERAIALGCAAEHAHRLVYSQPQAPVEATPIGVTCRLCHRTECVARSAPPIGRQILPDDIRRTGAPFGFSDS